MGRIGPSGLLHGLCILEASLATTTIAAIDAAAGLDRDWLSRGCRIREACAPTHAATAN